MYIGPRISDLGTSWRWVDSFTPRQYYHRYSLNRTMGGPQNPFGKFTPLSGLKFQTLSRPAVPSRYTDWAIPDSSCLVQLLYYNMWKVCHNIVTRRLVHATNRRVLVRMIGFISTLVTHSLLITLTHRQYSANAHLHNLQITVAEAVGFPVSTSRLLTTDLITGIITVSLNHTLRISRHYSTHKVFTSHFKSS
jgi:hypothetical protein